MKVQNVFQLNGSKNADCPKNTQSRLSKRFEVRHAFDRKNTRLSVAMRQIQVNENKKMVLFIALPMVCDLVVTFYAHPQQ